MKRRQFLSTLAAASTIGSITTWRWATSSKTPSLPQGEIVGASDTLGHRLRIRQFPEPKETLKTPVIIIGGGVAGLSAGWKLQQAGFTDFTILELEPEVGGHSRYGESAITAYPWGAHYLPFPTQESRAVRELLADFGVLRGEILRRWNPTTTSGISTLYRKSDCTPTGFGTRDYGHRLASNQPRKRNISTSSK